MKKRSPVNEICCLLKSLYENIGQSTQFLLMTDIFAEKKPFKPPGDFFPHKKPVIEPVIESKIT